ncbi:ankyrin repeat-containing domain protein [Podospora aff. communis PSN243]|uniref:Ankyrin repeat-containing domain protein n=1 Tax=Podospora aff. communis PSN243 TaxID=3040156 RepID=A0AAV9G886_9PEZI|nr:ankyrin repeat-containing domain protein [Podospora aff. communis PSN243]
MHILHLPIEVFDFIMHHCIISRTLPRALRLKLVCKSFRASFNRVFLHTNMLDDKKWSKPFRDSERQTRKDHGAATLWHDYLLFRCRQNGETTTCSPDFSYLANWVNGIRNAADALLRNRQEQLGLQHNEADRDEVIDKLCWLAIDCSRSGEEVWYGQCRSSDWGNLGLRALSAATYLGYAPLVRQLLAQGHDPTANDYLFPSPMYIASRTGQADLLLLMQESLHELDGDALHYQVAWPWRYKIEPESLTGAAARGDLEMVQLCLYPPSRSIPEEGTSEKRQSLIMGHKPGSVPPLSYLEGCITRAMIVARSPEVYEYLNSLLSSPPETPSNLPLENLKVMARAGNLAMVRHHLDNDLKSWDEPTLNMALAEAVRSCNIEVVDLLLERGADPNAWQDSGHTILSEAARTGSMVMMRRLVDAGIKVRDSREAQAAFPRDIRALRHAVKLEHAAIVELLLDMGAGTRRTRLFVLRMAEKLGLESMVGLLRSRRIGSGTGGGRVDEAGEDEGKVEG